MVLLAFWLTYSRINPYLHYHSQKISFSNDFNFFKSYLYTPGGIANYLAEFIAQFFYFNLWGSLLIVAIASLQGMIAVEIMNRHIGKTKFYFSIFGVILIMGVIVFFDYRYPCFLSVRLLMAFLAIWLFCFVSIKYPRLRPYLWLVIAILLFYLAGGVSLIVYAISTSLILITTTQKKIWISSVPVFLVFAVILPFFTSKFLLPSSLLSLYSLSEAKPAEMMPYTASYTVYFYYALLPVILLIALFFRHRSTASPIPNRSKSKTDSKVRFYRSTSVILGLQVIGCACLGYFLFVKSEDPIGKKLLLIDYYAQNEKWNEILNTAETIEVYNSSVNYQINRAYAHLGLLPEHLFNYPQLLGSKGLFLDESVMNNNNTMDKSDLAFDLGYMDEAQRWAFEAQTLYPNSPRILKRLALINIINRKYNVGKKFLNVLRKNWLCKDWVSKYEKYVTDTALAATDPLIAEKRRYSPKENAYIFTPFENLQLLLKTNKNNRMAYDYMLSLCILEKSPNFIEYMQHYSYYKIKALPRSWEEALAAYMYQTRNVPEFVNSETVSKDCWERLNAFNKTLSKYNNSKDAAKNALRQNFENTYWYYLFYLKPSTSNVLNKNTQL